MKPAKSIYDQRYIELITRLRKLRDKKGISQIALAKSLGKPQSYISKVETCERRLDVIEFLELCKAMQIRIELIIPNEYRELLEHEKEEEKYRKD